MRSAPSICNCLVLNQFSNSLYSFNSQFSPLRNTHSTVDKHQLIPSLRKRPIWKLRKPIVKRSLLPDNKLLSHRVRMRLRMPSSRSLHQNHHKPCCRSESQFQATVVWTGEFKQITCSVWLMLRHARWPPKVSAKSITKRVKPLRRRVCGNTSSEDVSIEMNRTQ